MNRVLTIVHPFVFLRLFPENRSRQIWSRDWVQHGDITPTRKDALEKQLKVESRPRTNHTSSYTALLPGQFQSIQIASLSKSTQTQPKAFHNGRHTLHNAQWQQQLEPE
jgi:hypothetical protein